MRPAQLPHSFCSSGCCSPPGKPKGAVLRESVQQHCLPHNGETVAVGLIQAGHKDINSRISERPTEFVQPPLYGPAGKEHRIPLIQCLAETRRRGEGTQHEHLRFASPNSSARPAWPPNFLPKSPWATDSEGG